MKLSNLPLIVALALLLALPATAKESSLTKLEMALRNATTQARKALVAIEVSRIEDVGPPQTRNNRNPMQQMMRQFTRRARRTHAEYFKRPGGKVSGFLTSYYNVAGKLDGIRVYLPGGKVLPAKLLGMDKAHDIAMLQVVSSEATEWPHLTPAETGEVQIGSFAIISSRSPSTTLSGTEWGIVSAVNRYRGTTLQIDARINYGNTGGPVVDLRGRLIGMACRLTHWDSRGQNSGVGYAVSGSYIKKMMPRLAAGEVISAPKRPFLGIQGEDASPGVRIVAIVSGTAAQKAGLRAGDVILSFNGHKKLTMQRLVGIIQGCRIGQKVKIAAKRGEKLVDYEIVLGSRKEGQ